MNNVLNDLWREVQGNLDAAELARVKADPIGHKLTRLMEEGKPASYRYYKAGKDARGREVRFAWCTNRNAAGFYLGFREVYDPKRQTIKRDQFTARRVRARVSELALRRSEAWKAARS